MSLEEWEESPPELRAKVEDPYYTEDVGEEDVYVDEEWDGESEETGSITGDELADEILREKARKLATLHKIIDEKEKIMKPARYGLPDLMRPCDPMETEEQLEDWRKAEMKKLIEEKMYAVKGGRRIDIKMVDKMIDAIYNVFYGKSRKVIWWKVRGGGGSLTAAILIWLLMVYQQREIINMAGSGEQAANIYDYVTNFWDCFPAIKRDLIDGEALMKRTQLRTGSYLKCITASEKSVRGKHASVMVVDEACQDDEQAERAMISAISGAMSEDDAIIIMLSTFHHPIGLFQEYWDLAEERGFQKEKWDIFDIMAPCKMGMETATSADPTASRYCADSCPFSWKEEKRRPDGTLEEIVNRGCWGKARTSQGFMTYEKVLEAYKLHKGTKVFEIEFCCVRPQYEGTIYPAEIIDPCIVPYEELHLSPEHDVAVGIDWGLSGQTAIIPIVFNGDTVDVPEAHFMTGKSVDEVIGTLLDLNETYGDFTVYADISHPFNNMQLQEFGFEVNAVAFKKWKEVGIANITRFLIAQKLRINKALGTFIEQMKLYKRNKQGKPIKKNDHGPDALNAGLLAFFFSDLFPDLALELGDEEWMKKVELMRKGKTDRDDGAVKIF